jgi:hypothetical protein
LTRRCSYRFECHLSRPVETVKRPNRRCGGHSKCHRETMHMRSTESPHPKRDFKSTWLLQSMDSTKRRVCMFRSERDTVIDHVAVAHFAAATFSRIPHLHHTTNTDLGTNNSPKPTFLAQTYFRPKIDLDNNLQMFLR